MNATMYYQQVDIGNSCKKCGRHLIVVALEGKVFQCCLRCDHRKIVSRELKKPVKREWVNY